MGGAFFTQRGLEEIGIWVFESVGSCQKNTLSSESFSGGRGGSSQPATDRSHGHTIQCGTSLARLLLLSQIFPTADALRLMTVSDIYLKIDYFFTPVSHAAVGNGGEEVVDPEVDVADGHGA